MSDADIDASSHDEQADTSSTKGKGTARQRKAGAAATEAASSSASTATAAAAAAPLSSASPPPTAASLLHANHGRSASSAHICSNTASCPLIAAWDAAAPDDRDKLPLSEDLFACSACKSVLYCSRDCQAAHWIDGGHKAECPKLAHKWAETPEPGAAAAAPVAAAASVSSHGSSGAAAAPVRRQYRLNFNIAFGPRSLIVLFLLLYLIYRFTRSGRANDADTAAHAEL